MCDREFSVLPPGKGYSKGIRATNVIGRINFEIKIMIKNVRK